MAEMVLAIPLLMLMAAGMFQFTQLFLARVRFDQACGSAARQWAAGQVRGGECLRTCLWEALGPERILFDRESLDVGKGRSGSRMAGFGGEQDGGGLVAPIAGIVRVDPVDYEGVRWTVRVRCRPVPLFSWLFKDGVEFTTRMAVLRHPADP
jgi:hypothetical protein